jgi:hypothetical protein
VGWAQSWLAMGHVADVAVRAVSVTSSAFSGAVVACKDLETDVAACFCRVVVLLRQDRAGKADECVAGGEAPTTSVRQRISRFRRSCGLLHPLHRLDGRARNLRGPAVSACLSVGRNDAHPFTRRLQCKLSGRCSALPDISHRHRPRPTLRSDAANTRDGDI